MIELHTERIRFRHLRESDYPDLKRYFADIDNVRYLGGLRNAEEAWRTMAIYLGHYQLKGYSYLALEDMATGQFLGCMGLWDSEPWPELELGYWIDDRQQRRGFAEEAA